MGTFEAFYASPAQHPWLLFAAAVAALVFCRLRAGIHPSVRRYCTLLAGLSLADAWLTSAHVYGLGALSGPAARFVPLFFVLAGDFRFLLLFAAATPEGGLAPSARALVASAGLMVIVPILSQGILALLPDSGSRVLFLVYEVLFLLLSLALLRWHPRVAEVAWLRPVCRFVLLYYGLWATADAILLATGSDLGFALRVVPNVLYYGGLIALIGWAASRPGTSQKKSPPASSV